jgi:hypothetical protein
MNRRLLIPLLVALVFSTFLAAAEGQIIVSLDLRNPGDQSIAHASVPVGTAVYVSAYYADPVGKLNALASLKVYVDKGSGMRYKATLFGPSVVKSGSTIKAGPYVVTEIGQYTFVWTCEKQIVPRSRHFRQSPPVYRPETRQVRAFVRTMPANKLPEPGPIAGLALGGLALGLFAVKRKRL